jgi:hypothetical protein
VVQVLLVQQVLLVHEVVQVLQVIKVLTGLVDLLDKLVRQELQVQVQQALLAQQVFKDK